MGQSVAKTEIEKEAFVTAAKRAESIAKDSPLSSKQLIHAVQSKWMITQMIFNKLLEDTSDDPKAQQKVIDANVSLVENFQSLIDTLTGTETTQFTEKKPKSIGIPENGLGKRCLGLKHPKILRVRIRL